MTGVLRERVAVRADPETVWSYVTDWPRQREWVPLTTTRVVSGGGTAVGARVEARTGLGRLGFRDPLTVTRWDPPRCCEVLHTGRLVRGEAGFAITPRGAAGCELEWWERVVVPGGLLGRLAWRLAAPALGLGLRATLRRLKLAVEG